MQQATATWLKPVGQETQLCFLIFNQYEVTVSAARLSECEWPGDELRRQATPKVRMFCSCRMLETESAWSGPLYAARTAKKRPLQMEQPL